MISGPRRLSSTRTVSQTFVPCDYGNALNVREAMVAVSPTKIPRIQREVEGLTMEEGHVQGPQPLLGSFVRPALVAMGVQD